MKSIDHFAVNYSGCIHSLFEIQAAATPHNVALVFGDQQVTYQALNNRSNQLAHYLVAQGVRPGILVGICVDRTIELVVGLLAILKAGAAYVPIDPQYPHERQEFMLKDSAAPLLLTYRVIAQHFALANTRLIYLDELELHLAQQPSHNPDPTIEPNDLAYVIYTSGSTGVPKGALISHHNVIRLFRSTQDWFQFNASDVWTLFHSCAFDFSVWELWGALFFGGRLVVVPFGLSRTPVSFYQLLRDEKVTVLNQTPSAFRQLIKVDESSYGDPTLVQKGPQILSLSLRLVIFGGEALDFKSLKPWFDRHGDTHPQLVNMYGITETTVHVTYRPIVATDLNASSVIGIPIPDLQIYLLDDAQQRVPNGSIGEIYVGGAGVGRGYLNRPELTVQKFVRDPFNPQSDRRLYRSGDLGRYLPNGDLEYLGRMDTQVKIRGFRIELGEISAAIERHPGVRESIVTARDNLLSEKTLSAYVVKHAEHEVAIPELRQMLRDQLPEYMIPTAFEFIQQIPLTVNGKIDLAALPPATRSNQEPTSVDPELNREPLTGQSLTLEQRISAVWGQVLQIPDPDRDVNFFDAGGNSIHLAEVHVSLQQQLAREFPITDLFTHTTIRSLAAHLEDGATSTAKGSANEHQMRGQRQREALNAQRNLRRRT